MDDHVIQALDETRSLAEDHAGEDGWDELRARVEVVLDRLTDDVGDPATPVSAAGPDGGRPVPEDAELAVAALMAVHDRPEPEQLELAKAAVDELELALDAA